MNRHHHAHVAARRRYDRPTVHVAAAPRRRRASLYMFYSLHCQRIACLPSPGLLTVALRLELDRFVAAWVERPRHLIIEPPWRNYVFSVTYMDGSQRFLLLVPDSLANGPERCRHVPVRALKVERCGRVEPVSLDLVFESQLRETSGFPPLPHARGNDSDDPQLNLEFNLPLPVTVMRFNVLLDERARLVGGSLAEVFGADVAGAWPTAKPPAFADELER